MLIMLERRGECPRCGEELWGWPGHPEDVLPCKHCTRVDDVAAIATAWEQEVCRTFEDPSYATSWARRYVDKHGA